MLLYSEDDKMWFIAIKEQNPENPNRVLINYYCSIQLEASCV